MMKPRKVDHTIIIVCVWGGGGGCLIAVVICMATKPYTCKGSTTGKRLIMAAQNR